MKKLRINLASSGNLAFVIVVAASYLSAISALIYSQRSLSPLDIGVLIVAGSAYLIVGTYGFTVARQSGTRRAATTYFIVQILIAATLIKLRGSAGELSLILLPLAGQSALLLPSLWMGAVCLLIYIVLSRARDPSPHYNRRQQSRNRQHTFPRRRNSEEPRDEHPRQAGRSRPHPGRA